MAFIPSSNSVVGFQSQPSSLLVGASVMGAVPVTQTTSPWVVNVPTPSYISYQAAGSVLAVSGSFSATPQPSINALQIAGSVLAVNMPSPSIIAIQSAGSIQAVNFPSPSTISYQLAGSIMAVSGSFTANPQASINALQLAGSVMAVRTDNASVVAVLSNSSVTALQGTNPWQINMPSPSVIAIQAGGSIQAVNFPSPSTIAYQAAGSVLAVSQGTNPWVIGSIVGTFADNTAFTNNDKGIAILGVRNDTVASVINADKQYGQHAIDSAGRVLFKPFAATETSIYAHASVVNGGDSGSVLVVSGAGTGLRNYITDWAVSNTGSVATLITFTEGGGSVLGRTIAPAGGGSNFPGAMMPLANIVPNQPINMVTATASSVVYVTVRGYKAP